MLANPPFIPVPPSRSGGAAAALRPGEGFDGNGVIPAPRCGLFSSGGASGEDCLHAVARLAPTLLRPNGGLLAVVLEFMNPGNGVLTSRLEGWWDSDHVAEGVLFTNERALDSDTYARPRAARGNNEDVIVWRNHLCSVGIRSVLPGLLFVETKSGESSIGQH